MHFPQQVRLVRFIIVSILGALLAPIASAQIAPAGNIYVQQPTGVHYFFGTAGAQSGAGFFYVNYQTNTFDIIAPVQVSPSGSFSGTSALSGRSISGQVNATTITLTYNGSTITGAKEAPYGPTARFAGGYSGSLTEPTLGLFNATVTINGHGTCLAFAINSSQATVGVGTIDSSGNISIKTTVGEQLTAFNFNPVRGFAQGSVFSSAGYTYNYALNRLLNARLANIATRGLVGSGEQVLIGGFIIKEAGKTVLINAKGPSLIAAGVKSPVLNPRLDLYLNGQSIASNANWRSNLNATDIANSGAGPTDDREASLQVSLEPGAYTVIVSSEDPAQQGIGIVEVYGLD